MWSLKIDYTGPSMLGRRIELLCNIVDVKGRVILFGGAGILGVFFALGIAFSATSLCSTYFLVCFSFPVLFPIWPNRESISPRIVYFL